MQDQNLEMKQEQTQESAVAGAENDIQQLAGAIVSAIQQTQSKQTETESNSGNNPYYEVTDELLLTQNPDHYVLTEKSGDDYRGLPVYEDAPQAYVPRDSAYISGDLLGDVSTKEELCRALRGENYCPLLIGDAGTAKNTSVDSVYSTINQPVYRMQCGAGLTVFDLIAETDMRDGNTVTTLKPFGKAAVFGGLAVADEINLANDGLIAHLNAMAEEKGKRKVTIPGTGVTLRDLPEDEEWDPDKHLGKYLHPEFKILGTRNPATYAGANEINDALNDRFTPIRYQYQGVDVESEILAGELGLTKEDVKPLIKVVQNGLREPRKSNEGTTCPISYRRVRDAVEYSVGHGVSLYNGAMVKIGGYAQNEPDKEFIEGEFKDNKSKLSTIPGSDETDSNSGNENTLTCDNCGKTVEESNIKDDSLEDHGLCGSCGGALL